jgi:hypothetical protein
VTPGGTWRVYGLWPLPVSHLPSLSASIDYAREECAASPATIELMIDGFCLVAYQERGWHCQLVAPEGGTRCHCTANSDRVSRLAQKMASAI